jgi:mono/diheme cytochrome c family protein
MERSTKSSVIAVIGLIIAYRYLKVAQSKEQNIGSPRPYVLIKGAVTCAVSITAMAAAFGLAACSNAGVPTPTSKVAAERTITSSVEGQSESTEILARGAKVYATSCQPCHGDRYGKGTVGRADPHNENGHTWHHPDAQLKDWILHGRPGPGVSVMPALTYLTEDDVEAVLAFIKTWWTAEQREIQAHISRRFEEALGKNWRKKR